MTDQHTYPEQFWHVHVALRPTEPKREVESVVNDLRYADMCERIVRPWREHRPFTIGGVVVRPGGDNVEIIRVVRTPHSQAVYAEQHNARMRASHIGDLATNRRLLPFSAADSAASRTSGQINGSPPENATSLTPKSAACEMTRRQSALSISRGQDGLASLEQCTHARGHRWVTSILISER